jgi:hypothetical protein
VINLIEVTHAARRKVTKAKKSKPPVPETTEFRLTLPRALHRVIKADAVAEDRTMHDLILRKLSTAFHNNRSDRGKEAIRA